MSALPPNRGGIIPSKRPEKPSAPTPETEFKLPFAMRGTEPIFRYLIQTAERSYQMAQRYVELAEQQLAVEKELLSVVKELLTIVPGPSEPEPENTT